MISEQYHSKKFIRKTILIIGMVTLLLAFFFLYLEWQECYDMYAEHECDDVLCYDYSCGHTWDDFRNAGVDKYSDEHYSVCWRYYYYNCYFRTNWFTAEDYAFSCISSDVGRWTASIITLAVGLLLSLIVFLFYHNTKTDSIEITDSHIRGREKSKEIELDIASVDDVKPLGKYGLKILTKEGSHSFRWIQNRDAIEAWIKNAVTPSTEIQTTQELPQSTDFQQLKELKELLDAGIITEEEFNQKKKQLLGI